LFLFVYIIHHDALNPFESSRNERLVFEMVFAFGGETIRILKMNSNRIKSGFKRESKHGNLLENESFNRKQTSSVREVHFDRNGTSSDISKQPKWFGSGLFVGD
jgi:hypothetical protein